MDNSDQSGVKRGLEHYRDKMQKINTWTYEGTNKGVTKTNEISLYKIWADKRGCVFCYNKCIEMKRGIYYV